MMTVRKIIFMCVIEWDHTELFASFNLALCLGHHFICMHFLLGFSGGSVIKNLPANAGDTGLIPGSGRPPGEGNGNPLQYPLPGKSRGQRTLEGYSPWG